MSIVNRLIAYARPAVPRPIIGRFSERYIAGSTLDDAMRVVRELNRGGIMATVDVLGEHLTRIEESHDVSFTVDLLHACRMRTRAGLYFIIGADSLAEFPGWKDPGEILRLATLVVFARDNTPLRLEVPGEAGIVIFESPKIDVSSTALRRQLAAGGADPALAPGVAEYAARHALYRAAR